ncbi:MAG: hypothetical protein IRZ15_14965, partial [Bryobacteraceae bacterium]|nr:hypothetical protein [Bryobacteraceae bacterium]
MRRLLRITRLTAAALLLAFGAWSPAWAASYNAVPVAGGFSSDGVPAIDAPLAILNGIAADYHGNLILADTGDHRIRRLLPSGILETLAGDGVPGFSGDGGPAAEARINSPYGVAVDRSGNIYFADLENKRVRRIDPDGIITTVAGGGDRIPGETGIPALDARLESPRNVAVDVDGNLYISDFYAHRVYFVSRSGTIVTIAGTGTPGWFGEGGPPRQAQLSYPAGLALDASGALYIADSGNRAIRKLSQGLLTTVRAGFLVFSLRLPTGVALDGRGGLIVADGDDPAVLPEGSGIRAVTGKDVVMSPTGAVFVAGGPYVTQLLPDGSQRRIAGSGTFGFHGDGGPATEAQLGMPSAVAPDGAGGFYIADERSHRVRYVNPGGVISTTAGTGEAGLGSEGGFATLSTLNAPRGLAVDREGNLYISDTLNHRIRKVDRAGMISTAAEKLEEPHGIAFDPEGNLYIAERGLNRVIRRTRSGRMETVANVESPRGVAVDADGALYVSGRSGIYRVTPSSGVETISPLADVSAVAVSGSGEVWLADAASRRVGILRADGELEPVMTDISATCLAPEENGAMLVCDSTGRILRLTPSSPPTGDAQRAIVLHAASRQPGPVAPGGLVFIEPAGDEVRFDGQTAQILSKETGLVEVPPTLEPGAEATLEVLREGRLIATAALEVHEAVPALFG